MPNVKISELPAITSPTTADLVPVVQSGVTDQITRGDFLKNVDADATFTDITTNNASTSKHGFLKKLDNNSAHFLDGTGAWSTPPGGYTDEQAQDAVGVILDNGTVGDINFTYDDPTPKISGVVKSGAITEAKQTLADNTTGNVTSTKHGYAPKSPSDATQFLNGAATPAFAQVKDSDLSISDITTNNVSTTKHGFCPKLPNDSSKFLDGTGAFSAAGGGGLTIGSAVSGGGAQEILFVDGSGNLANSSTFTFTPAVHGHFEITDSTPNYVKIWANDSSSGSPMIQLSQGGGSRLLTLYCDSSGGSRALITTSGANELRLTSTGNIRGMFLPTGVEGCLGLDDNSGNALYIRESGSDLIASNNAGTTPNANYSAKRLKYNEALFSNNSFAAPGSPTDGDFWIEASGTSPARTIKLQVRDGGGTRTLATLTY